MGDNKSSSKSGDFAQRGPGGTDKFLKNGITNKPFPEMRYTKAFMEGKYMIPVKHFPVRIDAWNWEYQQNLIKRGTLNLNMH